LDGRVRRLGQGDEDDRDPRVDRPDLLVDLQAGLVGQAQVEENDVRGPSADALEPFGAGAGHLDPVTGGGERLAQLLRDHGRVVSSGVAVLAPVVSLLVRWPISPLLPRDAVPHMTFFPAVMIAAYFGGLGPGLLATVLSAVAANWFLTKQLASVQVSSVNND